MKKILYIALAAAMLAGCDKEDNGTKGPQDKAVNFTAGMQTSAVEAAWEADDRVGVFAFDGVTAVANGNNELYKIDNTTTGAMSPAVTGSTISFPKGKNLSFYAYYPYSTTAVSGTTLAIHVADQSTAAKIKACGLIWAKAENQTSTNVPLPFAHKMTQLHFDIEAVGMNISDLTGMTATLKGANATASFDLKAGTFSAPAAGDITLNVVVNATNKTKATIEAFVVPTADISAVELVLKAAGGEEFDWRPATGAWTGGEKYAYPIANVKYIPTDGRASSYQPRGNIDYSFDGDLNTFYHSNWSNSGRDYFPITLEYDMPQNADRVDFIEYYTRRDSHFNGHFKVVELWVNTHENNTFIKLGEWDFEGKRGMHLINIAGGVDHPKTLRFVILSGEGDGQGFASCAEMCFYKSLLIKRE